MALDLTNLQKTKVTRDLRSKFIFIYGAPKIGKTTLAARFPNNLLLGVEHGFNLIDDISAVDVPTWAEFKKYVKQLENDGRIAKGHKILIIPSCNPYSINIQKRFWPIDNTDINRITKYTIYRYGL